MAAPEEANDFKVDLAPMPSAPKDEEMKTEEEVKLEAKEDVVKEEEESVVAHVTAEKKVDDEFHGFEAAAANHRTTKTIQFKSDLDLNGNTFGMLPTSLYFAGSSSDGVAGASQGRFPVNGGITGYVATTGETVNITDAYNDPRFLIDFSTIVPKYTMKEKIPFSAF